MALVVVDSVSNRLRKSEDVQFADRVVQQKKVDPWKAIEEMVKGWMERSPEEFQAFKVHLTDTREVQIDPKFGRTRNQDQERRLTLVLPQALMSMIRSMFKADELQMDKQFYAEFARRFPFFRIPEKL